MDERALLEFPCDFSIKAMGRNSAEFQALVIELVKRHTPDLDLASMITRESRGGRFLSITLTVRATSRNQLDAIYRDLSADKRVLIAL